MRKLLVAVFGTVGEQLVFWLSLGAAAAPPSVLHIEIQKDDVVTEPVGC